MNTSDFIPNDANSKEVFMFEPVDLTIENGTTVFFAIKAVDKANLTSPISNIAQASLYVPEVPAGVSISTIVLSVVGAVAGICIIAGVTLCILNKNKR